MNLNTHIHMANQSFHKYIELKVEKTNTVSWYCWWPNHLRNWLQNCLHSSLGRCSMVCKIYEILKTHNHHKILMVHCDEIKIWWNNLMIYLKSIPQLQLVSASLVQLKGMGTFTSRIDRGYLQCPKLSQNIGN